MNVVDQYLDFDFVLNTPLDNPNVDEDIKKENMLDFLETCPSTFVRHFDKAWEYVKKHHPSKQRIHKLIDSKHMEYDPSLEVKESNDVKY